MRHAFTSQSTLTVVLAVTMLLCVVTAAQAQVLPFAKATTQPVNARYEVLMMTDGIYRHTVKFDRFTGEMRALLSNLSTPPPSEDPATNYPRFQIFADPASQSTVYLLDTQTGKIWQHKGIAIKGGDDPNPTDPWRWEPAYRKPVDLSQSVQPSPSKPGALVIQGGK